MTGRTCVTRKVPQADIDFRTAPGPEVGINPYDRPLRRAGPDNTAKPQGGRGQPAT